MLFVRHNSRYIGGEESSRIFMESLITILLSENREVGSEEEKEEGGERGGDGGLLEG